MLELVPGETLAERLRKALLSGSDAIAMFSQLAEAMEAAHRGRESV